jgi:hypothetical protein
MPGQHVVQTLLLKPNTFLPMTTQAIPLEYMPAQGIKPFGGGRVSSTKQETKGEGLQDQTSLLANHAFTHNSESITPLGMTCFLETCSAYNKVPEALLLLLNDPILSRCDSDGDCIACNVYYVKCAERVMKQVEPFIEIRDALSLRNINIWSITENIGSRSHPDQFLDLIKAGVTLGDNQSTRAHLHAMLKGLRHSSEHPPTKQGDPWCKAEDDRLRDFMDLNQIQDKYLNLNTLRGTTINWTILAQDEFPFRTTNDLVERFRQLKRRHA